MARKRFTFKQRDEAFGGSKVIVLQRTGQAHDTQVIIEMCDIPGPGGGNRLFAVNRRIKIRVKGRCHGKKLIQLGG